MKLLKFVVLAWALAGMAAFSPLLGAPRPNILFIFIDDIGWGDLSCYGSPVTNKLGQPITPNLDRLAGQGIRFTQGYVAAPICSPSRTGVLTGIEPTRYAIHSFLDKKSSNAAHNMADWVQPDTVSAPRLFQQAGYRTGQFGKWHMGGGRDVNNAPFPQEYGFEESLVAFEGMGNRVLYNGHPLSQQNADVPGTIEWIDWHQGAGRHTDAALTFITNAVAAGKPFYVHVPYNDTHSPYNVPPGQENDFDHITTGTDAKTFLSELHNLDKQIGRLVGAVDALGAGTNTIVVIVGDNGAPNDSLNQILKRNGGLRGGKGNLYEGGIRELFIVRCPGRVPAGVVNSGTVVSTLDLLPTYCALADIPLPDAPFAGEDMSDVFLGASRPRGRPLFWEYGAVAGLSPGSPKLAVRQGPYKFMRDPEGTRGELYRIPEDHAEATNLVNNAALKDIVDDLEAKLMTWYDSVVLGNVGEAYPCTRTNFSGTVIGDAYNVPDDNSPTSGFGANAGINFDIAPRLEGAAAGLSDGYRLGTTAGASARQPSDFSIVQNRLTVAPRNGNGRFELSPDGASGQDFGGFLAGRRYTLSIQMDVDVVGANYAQRISLSVSDTSDAAIGDVNLGVQIGSDGAGGLGVWKRLDGAAVAGGLDINTRLMNGLPIGVPVDLEVRVVDSNTDTTSFASSYEILVNGAAVNTGAFRFNGSASARYLVFDVAAHEGPAHYDNLRLAVAGDAPGLGVCRKPILSVADCQASTPPDTNVRLYWTAQPGLRVQPEVSTNLTTWRPVRDTLGNPVSVTTEFGTIQWLEVAAPAAPGCFFRLKRE